MYGGDDGARTRDLCRDSDLCPIDLCPFGSNGSDVRLGLVSTTGAPARRELLHIAANLTVQTLPFLNP